jgi:hypothetical protein
MKRILILTMTFFPAVMTQAQESIPDNLPLPLMQSRVEPPTQEPKRILPDAPIPVLPNIQDGPLPCPAGIGKPCPLLGGRLYFRDPSHMTEHDATLGKAMRNRFMVFGGLMNLASTIADIEGTEACMNAHTCIEGNPLFGRNPSRAKSYGIGIPMMLTVYTLSSWLKKQGDGNLAFGLLWSGTVLHAYEAAQGFAMSNTGALAKPNSATAQRLGLVIRF